MTACGFFLLRRYTLKLGITFVSSIGFQMETFKFFSYVAVTFTISFVRKVWFFRPLKKSTDQAYRQCLHKIIELMNRIKSISH